MWLRSIWPLITPPATPGALVDATTPWPVFALATNQLLTTGLTLLGVVVTAVAGYLGVRTTTRSARRTAREASSRAAAVEQTKIDSEAYGRARESYEAALAVSNQRIVGMQENIDRVRADRRVDREEYETEIRELRERIGAGEREHVRLREVMRVTEDANMRLTVWARTVHSTLQHELVAAAMAQAHLGIPRPPAGVSDTDPSLDSYRRGRAHE